MVTSHRAVFNDVGMPLQWPSAAIRFVSKALKPDGVMGFNWLKLSNVSFNPYSFLLLVVRYVKWARHAHPGEHVDLQRGQVLRLAVCPVKLEPLHSNDGYQHHKDRSKDCNQGRCRASVLVG